MSSDFKRIICFALQQSMHGVFKEIRKYLAIILYTRIDNQSEKNTLTLKSSTVLEISSFFKNRFRQTILDVYQVFYTFLFSRPSLDCFLFFNLMRSFFPSNELCIEKIEIIFRFYLEISLVLLIFFFSSNRRRSHKVQA